MKNEQRKIEDCQLLDALLDAIDDKSKSDKSIRQITEQFKADNDLLPSDKWNKWLVCEDYPKWLGFYDNKNNIVYGIDIAGDCFCSQRKGTPEGYDIATTEEATERLAKIATEIGYVEGVEVKYLQHDTNTYVIQKGDSFHFGDSDMTKFNIGLITIMKDGKWAKILPSENKIKKLEEKERRLANKLENTRKKLNELKGE